MKVTLTANEGAYALMHGDVKDGFIEALEKVINYYRMHGYHQQTIPDDAIKLLVDNHINMGDVGPVLYAAAVLADMEYTEKPVTPVVRQVLHQSQASNPFKGDSINSVYSVDTALYTYHMFVFGNSEPKFGRTSKETHKFMWLADIL